jgi:hypothetical protein
MNSESTAEDVAAFDDMLSDEALDRANADLCIWCDNR